MLKQLLAHFVPLKKIIVSSDFLFILEVKCQSLFLCESEMLLLQLERLEPI